MANPGAFKKVLIIGSGPIIIGQAAEFDYSGSQACKALKEEGIFTILVNSNPATIQTDPEMADRTYLEPLDVSTLSKVIEKERPDGILGTMGGQVGLNLTAELAKEGILAKYNVKVLGTDIEAIKAGEDREAFRDLMHSINQPVPKSGIANTVEEALRVAKGLGYPIIVRPAYCLGGTGSGIAFSEEQLKVIAQRGLHLSRIHQVLIEENVLGWAEIEYELVRDGQDNVLVICPMENVDPMGIHTGDSIVAAPLLTLSKEEDDVLRDASRKIVRALNIKGGCNVQLALNRSPLLPSPTRDKARLELAYQPAEEEVTYRVIEVNPRLSRSSALASKATAYPIARVAAKIALGKSLKEISIGPGRDAFFEPQPDYVVLKIPRWPFDKMPNTDKVIGTQMKGTGEVMAIGKSFEEALLKAVRSLEIENTDLYDKDIEGLSDLELKDQLKNPTDKRIFVIAAALRRNFAPGDISGLTKINQWFIEKIKGIIDIEERLRQGRASVKEASQLGISIKRMSALTGMPEKEIKQEVKPAYLPVAFYAPYFYSTYNQKLEAPTEVPPLSVVAERALGPKKIIVIGAGPIRIGQGIEFDYCCCHAVQALREEGIEAMMLNNNPETVSTDYDTSDKLYFEPLNGEDVENIIGFEKPDGVILQFGGQTSINLAGSLKDKVKILGTSEQGIALVEDRDKFSRFLQELNVKQARFGIAKSKGEAKAIAERIGYPVLVRPSYVLGGRAMEIVENERELDGYMAEALRVAQEHPILVDHFLENALECEVDALCDGENVYIPAVMEHIEKAGIHSGDSSCVAPPVILRGPTIEEIKRISRKIALALGTVGLVNIQFAVQKGEVYVLEANPRASRTIPYLSKATGIPLVKIATKILLGRKLTHFNLPAIPPSSGGRVAGGYAVKSVVFPFLKLPGVDFALSPEMKSTGEVMGISPIFSLAYFKALQAAGIGDIKSIFISLRNKDKGKLDEAAGALKELVEDYGVKLYATLGTARYLEKLGLEAVLVKKLSEEGLDAIELLRDKKIDLVINTFTGKKEMGDSFKIRRAAVDSNIYCVTTIEACLALIQALLDSHKNEIKLYPLGSQP